MLDWIHVLIVFLSLDRCDGQYFSSKNEPTPFAPKQGLVFLLDRGWKVSQFHSIWHESRRLRRGVDFAVLLEHLMRWFAKQDWEALDRQIGIVLLGRVRSISN